MTLPSFSALTRGLALLLIMPPLSASAHEGHVLDLFSALMEPLAGWDHLLMALMFLGVLALGLRIAIRALGRQRRSNSEDPS